MSPAVGFIGYELSMARLSASEETFRLFARVILACMVLLGYLAGFEPCTCHVQECHQQLISLRQRRPYSAIGKRSSCVTLPSSPMIDRSKHIVYYWQLLVQCFVEHLHPMPVRVGCIRYKEFSHVLSEFSSILIVDDSGNIKLITDFLRNLV
jgi:hypothetical protein